MSNTLAEERVKCVIAASDSLDSSDSRGRDCRAEERAEEEEEEDVDAVVGEKGVSEGGAVVGVEMEGGRRMAEGVWGGVELGGGFMKEEEEGVERVERVERVEGPLVGVVAAVKMARLAAVRGVMVYGGGVCVEDDEAVWEFDMVCVLSMGLSRCGDGLVNSVEWLFSNRWMYIDSEVVPNRWKLCGCVERQWL